MKLKDQVAVITGSGAGIGRAAAREFASEGALVVVADINFAAAQQTGEAIAAAGGTAKAIAVDVADADSVQRLVSETLQAFGEVHILFNNAAIQVNKTLEQTTPEEWNRQMSVNVGGIYHCSKFFLPYLRRTRGTIINMASVNGFFVEPACAGYCATKGAIIALTKAMAIDLGSDGIRVNCICPGYIDAGMAWGYFESQPDPAAARANAARLQALKRVGRPEEVARLAVFLASKDAAYMTGSSVVVDGGFGSGLPSAD